MVLDAPHGSRRPLSPATRDLIVIAILSVVVLFIASYANLFERMMELITIHESWQLDELIPLSIFLVIALAVFSYRRWREQERVSREAFHAWEELARVNRRLNLMTSITRHDIRNQLFVIRGSSRRARKEGAGPAAAEHLARIDAAAEAIRRQIEFTRQYEEVGVKAPAWFAIGDHILSVPHGTVPVSCSCTGWEILADPMIAIVFSNLFDNAARHGTSVTEIAIACRRTEAGLVITVADNGIGIPDDEKEKIFGKGYGKNTGFGLFLAQEILAITGIAITENGIYGQGASFALTVPESAYRTAREE